MATCKYCGKKTNFFSNSHKECEEKHEQGVKILDNLLRSYFNGNTPIGKINRDLAFISKDNYLDKDDITNSFIKTIDEWTNVIHWPFRSYQLDLVKDLISILGIPYNKLNETGSLDRLCQKMIRGFMAEYFTDQKTLQRSIQISQQVMRSLPLHPEKLSDTYYDILNQAGKNFLKNGSLSSAEQQKIEDYISALGLSLVNYPSYYRGSVIEELGQMAVLGDIKAGRQPRYSIQAPIVLGKDETALWCYNHVTMYQEKVKKEYVGSHGGFSFRIMKGVTYRTGGFKGRPVETNYMENMGMGSLYITNKNIIFMGDTRSIKVPYSKIIGINPYSDGMEVQRDGNNVKRLVFQGFDCSFVLNIISLVNQI